MGSENDASSGAMPDAAELVARMDRIEAQMKQLRIEMAGLTRSPVPSGTQSAPPPERDRAPNLPPQIADRLRRPPPSGGESQKATPPAFLGARLSAPELEGLVGRYATLALAAVVILMAVGAMIKMAVQRGLLTPEVRIAAGVVAACAAAAGGFYFRRRGDVRYGNVLLAIALAIVDLVAWGAGPRLKLVPTGVALGAVDVVAVGFATLALIDGGEFLFSVSVLGALSAPFVTAEGGGSPLALLAYGGIVLAGALRAIRNPAWSRAFALLLVGAFAYASAAIQLAVPDAWYGPFLVLMFAGGCGCAALLMAERVWRSELSRGFLLVAVVGVLGEWPEMVHRPRVAIPVAVALALVTHAALLVRGTRARMWPAGALLLPALSAAVAYGATDAPLAGAAVLSGWALLSLLAFAVEGRGGRDDRAGVHLLAGAAFGCAAIAAMWWADPFFLVLALASWGTLMALPAASSSSSFSLGAVSLPVLLAALSAFDQLASRASYSYAPFATRSSASALAATLGIGLAGAIVGRGGGEVAKLADGPVRLGALIGFLILWGRMEFANAFNRDLSSFLLTSYYAACGVASIIAGRRLSIGRLRVCGLGLALYAAVKAVVEVTEISSLLLRVGSYAAVGVFLLGAGYLYREARAEVSEGRQAMR